MKKYNMPRPKAGYEWVVGKVKKSDLYMQASGNIIRHIRGMNTWDRFTEGPSFWHTPGSTQFQLSGYIRRKKIT